MGAFYFINKKEVVDISTPNLVQNTVSPKVNNIQKVDSVVKSNIEREIKIKEIKNNTENLVYENVREKNDSIFMLKKSTYTIDEKFINKKDKSESNGIAYNKANNDIIKKIELRNTSIYRNAIPHISIPEQYGSNHISNC